MRSRAFLNCLSEHFESSFANRRTILLWPLQHSDITLILAQHLHQVFVNVEPLSSEVAVSQAAASACAPNPYTSGAIPAKTRDTNTCQANIALKPYRARARSQGDR